ncbi:MULTISPECIES: MFS transporter [Metabacillus]|uniref:MFS transporter n=3 Tax=Metabacillus TaxID=2675233 RepID=A0A179SMU6_9BACI|nr:MULTISPECIES: MFS transporter [Metabacillus]OAS83016.1 MFS transporter [Metabacillus litoralis]QNF27570.1 MFS transporter [Metabacillus sp. KUDC1714]
MNNESKQPIWTKSFISISLSNFFIFIAFYGLLTSLPIYVVDELHRSEIDAGLIVTIFLLSAIIVRPFSGKLLEDFGKKRMLMISLILFTICSFMYLLIENYTLLLALRFFQGIWFSIATTATGGIAADLVPIKRRGEGLGYFVMSTNLAVVFGPLIALTLIQVASFTILFLVFALLITAGVLFTASSKINEAASKETKSKKKLQFSDLIDRKALPIAFIGSLVAVAYSSVLSFLSIYAQELNLLDAASFFFVVFAVVMLVARPFSGRLFDSKGPHIVIYPALGLFLIGLVLLSLTQTSFMLLLSGAFIGLGYGTVVPSLQTLAIQATDRNRSGHATATFFTLFDTGIAAGSYILGIVATQLGYGQLYFYTAIFMIIVIVCYKLVLHRKEVTKFNLKETH